MSDIVERLRAGFQCDEAGNRCRTMDARSGCVCAEAADEITALRAENERLRAALGDIHAAAGRQQGGSRIARCVTRFMGSRSRRNHE